MTEKGRGRSILQRLQQLTEMRTTNLVHSNENTGKPPQYDEKPSELEQELTAPITSSRTINDAWAT